MALRRILTDEDSILHKVCRPVENFDEKLAVLLDDMHETLDK
ncbi:MAG: peptide deformylase, partial [Ruminococcus sp.]|nr:peptide deformylase [Ruminococcus sp.]